jgi:hypothetical protein
VGGTRWKKGCTSGCKSRHLTVAMLTISLLFVVCGRGYWVIVQCLHASQHTMIHVDPAHQGYLAHHHHTGSDLLDEADGATHQIIHIMDSIEYSVPVLLEAEAFRSPRYPPVDGSPQFPPDVVSATLYRPPKETCSTLTS